VGANYSPYDLKGVLPSQLEEEGLGLFSLGGGVLGGGGPARFAECFSEASNTRHCEERISVF